MRRAVVQQARGQARPFHFPAPVKGWVTNKSLAKPLPDSALVLDNWIPLASSARVRGGAVLAATLNAGSDAIESMWTYESGTVEKHFAADETSIYEVSAVVDSTTVPDPEHTDQTAGYYSAVQIGTSGGNYQYCVNGADPALLYDGTTFYEITGVATKGLAYDALSSAFTVGQTVTGGTSGATAEIVKVIETTGTTGTLWIKVASGTFQNDETITDGATGSATANIPSGVTDVQTATISSATTSNWSQGWLHANRLFFVRKNTMIVDYLPVDAIAGAAAQFSLAGVFQKGGAVLFGATWSLDSGSGLDDKCVFVSTAGEVAVYEGTDPSDSTAWSKVGVYNIGRPLNIKAFEKAGGDLLIATKEGIVPLSEAIRKDVAALGLAAITRAIEPDWRAESTTRSGMPWELVKWTANNMLLVNLPQTSSSVEPYIYVANLETGAWCRFTGWEARCMAVYGEDGYFGTSDGKVYKMDTGGQDGETLFTAVYVSSFDDFGSPANTKVAKSAYVTFRATGNVTPQISVSVNYSVDLPSAPTASVQGGDTLWDVAEWDVDTWSAGLTYAPRPKWFSIGRTGKAFAMQAQVTSGSAVELNVELVTSTILFEQGGMMV